MVPCQLTYRFVGRYRPSFCHPIVACDALCHLKYIVLRSTDAVRLRLDLIHQSPKLRSTVDGGLEVKVEK